MALEIVNHNTYSIDKERKMSAEWWCALNLRGQKQVKQLYFKSDRPLDGNIVHGYRSTLELVENAV